MRDRVGVCGVDARVAAVIRIDAVWLAVQPIDMRTGVDRLLASVVQVFGAAQAHHGFGVWCAAWRLNQGSFEWPRNVAAQAAPLALTNDQFDALVLGQRIEQMRVITRM